MIYFTKKKLGKIKINVPGKHNVLNSLAAISLGIELGVSIDILKNSINDYNGVRRRFDIKPNNSQIMVVDDYAHHPTEVKATINAARSGWDKNIVTVFQPHLFTRQEIFIRSLQIHYLTPII